MGAGLFRSVVLVLYLLRQNPVQQAAAELFGISRATVSRRWTSLLPVVEKVLAEHVPDPADASAPRVVSLTEPHADRDWASQGTTRSRASTAHRLQPPDCSHTRRGPARVSLGSPGVGTTLCLAESGFPDAFADRGSMVTRAT